MVCGEQRIRLVQFGQEAQNGRLRPNCEVPLDDRMRGLDLILQATGRP
jgi:hypothetical protein